MSFNIIGSKESPDLIYYNADIINGRLIDEGSGKDPKISFNETRDSPIVKDASQYYFSIVRFSMDGSNNAACLPEFSALYANLFFVKNRLCTSRVPIFY